MRYLALILALASNTLAALPTVDDARFLKAIAQVESSGRRNVTNGGINGAVGMYQMRWPAWIDANARLKAVGQAQHNRDEWQDPDTQDTMALAYLAVIRSRLKQMGNPDPSVEILALCWNQGCGYARSHDFVPNAYALKVSAIYLASESKK
jgi:hypothetical protein